MQKKIDEQFFHAVLSVLSKKDPRGSKCADQDLYKELEGFYNDQFQPLLKVQDKIPLPAHGNLQKYLTTDMLVAFKNNIQVHFASRLKYFAIQRMQQLLKDKSKEEKKGLEAKIFSAILSGDSSSVPEEYHKWIEDFQTNFLPPLKEKYKKKKGHPGHSYQLEVDDELGDYAFFTHEDFRDHPKQQGQEQESLPVCSSEDKPHPMLHSP